MFCVQRYKTFVNFQNRWGSRTAVHQQAMNKCSGTTGLFVSCLFWSSFSLDSNLTLVVKWEVEDMEVELVKASGKKEEKEQMP